MNKYSLYQRFKYWLDNKMSKGTGGMISILMVSLAAFVLVIGVLTDFVTDDNISLPQTLWDTFANTTNAWIITFEEAQGNLLHLALMGVAGIVGILVTSVLIGIFSNGIEQKITSLQKGKSKVLENKHVVVLGFNRNTYKFVEELCKSGIPKCIVVAGSEEKDVMEEKINSSISIPKHIKLVCRTIDTTDLNEIECCSIENASAVVTVDVSDEVVIKTILTVTKYLKDYPTSNPILVAVVNRERNLAVAQYAGEDRFLVFHTGAVVARIMAQACNQRGISQIFRELFSFDGNELYFMSADAGVGMDYQEVACRVQNATPLGIVRDGTGFLNPHGVMKIQPGDQLIVLAEQEEKMKLAAPMQALSSFTPTASACKRGSVVGIVGYTHYIKVILPELDEANCKIVCTAIPDNKMKTIHQILKEKDLSVDLCDYDSFLERLSEFDHIILLSDESFSRKEADNQTVYRLLTLRNKRKENHLTFDTVVELQQQKTKELLEGYSDSEYIVTADVSSMLASQLMFNPSLAPVFNEIITYEGNEIVLVDACSYQPEGSEISIKELRARLLNNEEVFLGYILHDQEPVLNPDYEARLTFHTGDQFIVLTDKSE